MKTAKLTCLAACLGLLAAPPLPAQGPKLLGTFDGGGHSVAISRDGELLAGGEHTGQMVLWEARGRKLKHIMDTGHHHLPSLAFSPDGKLLASASWDRTVRLWDLATGKEKATLLGHSTWVSCVAFSPDGKLLASGGGDKSIKLWDVAAARVKRTLKGHAESVTSVAFSPEGRLLASGSHDETVKLWDVRSGELKATFRGHADSVTSLAFNGQGTLLASGGGDKAVRLWDVATGRQRTVLKGHTSDVESVAFQESGRLVASGSRDETVKLWDVAAGKEAATLRGYYSPVNAVAFTADGKILATTENDGGIQLWHIPVDMRARLDETAPGRALPDGAVARLGVARTGGRRHAGRVRALGFEGNGERILSCSVGEPFRVWDPFRGTPCPTTPADQRSLEARWLASAARRWPLLCGHVWTGGNAVFSPAGFRGKSSWLRGCSADGTRLLWLEDRPGKEPLVVVGTAAEGKVLWQGSWKRPGRACTALSPDGRTVAMAGDQAVCFLDTATGKECWYELVGKNRPPLHDPRAVKFSPDGSHVAIAGAQGALQVLAVNDGRLVTAIRVRIWASVSAPVFQGMAFSSDGKTLAARGYIANPREDWEVVALWETATGRLIRYQEEGTVLFSPDNRVMATLGGGILDLHDLYSGELLKRYKPPAGFDGQMAFSPDGRLLAASCWDTTVLVLKSPVGLKAWPPQAFDEGVLGRLWEDLASGESARAYQAMGRLIAGGGRSVSFLEKRLRAVPRADARRVQRLVAELDDDEFDKREAATRELSGLGVSAGPMVREALRHETSPEVAKRLKRILRGIEEDEKHLSRAELAHVRAIQVLERIGTKEAKERLRSLAEGAENVRRSRDARDALERMGHNVRSFMQATHE